VRGDARALLEAERTALNFLQRLSGIATLTARFVDAARGGITILDTRKTTPGFRVLEKYAVRCGGGTNHRQRLDDGILIKDNHKRWPAASPRRREARWRRHRVAGRSRGRESRRARCGAETGRAAHPARQLHHLRHS
jgi:nicotinate-nucleotide pyrophosphorylase